MSSLVAVYFIFFALEAAIAVRALSIVITDAIKTHKGPGIDYRAAIRIEDEEITHTSSRGTRCLK